MTLKSFTFHVICLLPAITKKLFTCVRTLDYIDT